MAPQTGFLTFFAATLLALAVVVFTGLRAQRRIHFIGVAFSLFLLGTTIYYAEQLGAHYDLESAGAIHGVHLTIAKLAALSYLLPLASGWLTLRRPSFRPWHRVAALLTLGLTVAAAVTGTLMLLEAEPLPQTAANPLE